MNKYRYIYIIDDKTAFYQINECYDPAKDLVLTFDFWVKRKVSEQNGNCKYIDRIISPLELQDNNHIIYKYFKTWHLKSDKSDIFEFRSIPFGMSFRQEIWNDFSFYLRLRISLKILNDYVYDKIITVSSFKLVFDALNDLQFEYSKIDIYESVISYYFPIFRWNQNAIRPNTLKSKLRKIINFAIIKLQRILDVFGYYNKGEYSLFIQSYHPTINIIKHLSKDQNVNLILEKTQNLKSLNSIINDRLFPLKRMSKKYINEANKLIENLNSENHNRLILKDGDDATEGTLRIIKSCIEDKVSDYIRVLDSIIVFLNKRNLSYEILISNIGILSSLVDAYCKANGIDSYLIINGMLGKDYLDESKYATIINSYSKSIKNDYFSGMFNIVTLGDPRMDDYSETVKNVIDHKNPTITIGTSGYNPIDLNSYLSVEFDFMFDVFKALLQIRTEGKKFNINVKVRPNGYISQYSSFFEEYFPDMNVTLIDSISMKEVLKKTDLYISIYSQTLLEASSLGIPVIYYKKDVEINQTPFNERSELVTVNSIDSLVEIIKQFYIKSDIFDDFMRIDVIEKYIGPLDGNNLSRNLRFIDYILKAKNINDILCYANEINNT